MQICKHVQPDLGKVCETVLWLQTFLAEPAMEAPAKIAEECKAKITGFQELLPLITAICNGGLHARHWEQIAAVVGFDVRPDEVTSLRRLLDYNIQDHIKVVMSDVPLLPLSSPYHRTLLPVSPPQLIPSIIKHGCECFIKDLTRMPVLCAPI